MRNRLAFAQAFSIRSRTRCPRCAFAAYDFAGPGINLTGGDPPEQVKGIRVSADYFQVFGAPIAVGRTFTEEENRPEGPAVAVISNGLCAAGSAVTPQLSTEGLIL
jgi:hypothetical protein